MPDFYNFAVKTIDGTEQQLADYKGKALLIVNVASECGLTPQYEGLQKLHAELAPKGFAVLGFPCNQFAGQEPGTEAEIQSFCSLNYDVTFPLFSKIEVNGEKRHPLYKYLTSQASTPDGEGDIQWNFGKFVVDKSGKVVARFSPVAAPGSDEVINAIEAAL